MSVIKTEKERIDTKEATESELPADIVARYMNYVGQLTGKTDTNRVKPGMLDVKTPETLVQFVKKYTTIINYGSTNAFWDLGPRNTLLLAWCTLGSLANLEEGERLYCYDNVFADFSLSNGDPTDLDSIYTWIDVFTWDGWLKVFVITALWQLGTEIIMSTVIAWFMTEAMQQWGLPLCNNGELYLTGLLGEQIDLCVGN